MLCIHESKTFVCKNSKEGSPNQNCYFEIEFFFSNFDKIEFPQHNRPKKQFMYLLDLIDFGFLLLACISDKHKEQTNNP